MVLIIFITVEVFSDDKHVRTEQFQPNTPPKAKRKHPLDARMLRAALHYKAKLLIKNIY